MRIEDFRLAGGQGGRVEDGGGRVGGGWRRRTRSGSGGGAQARTEDSRRREGGWKVYNRIGADGWSQVVVGGAAVPDFLPDTPDSQTSQTPAAADGWEWCPCWCVLPVCPGSGLEGRTASAATYDTGTRVGNTPGRPKNGGRASRRGGERST